MPCHNICPQLEWRLKETSNFAIRIATSNIDTFITNLDLTNVRIVQHFKVYKLGMVIYLKHFFVFRLFYLIDTFKFYLMPSFGKSCLWKDLKFRIFNKNLENLCTVNLRLILQ